MEVSGQLYASAALSQVPIGNEGSVAPRADLDMVTRKNPCPCRVSNDGRPARSLFTTVTEL